MPPLISTVVITRNRSLEINRCIASVMAQDTTTALIVVDNASDEPLRIPSQTGMTVFRLNAPHGVASARNAALRGVKTPFVLLLDDDPELPGTTAISSILLVLQADERIAALALNCIATNLPPGSERRQMVLAKAVSSNPVLVTTAGVPTTAAAEFIGAGCAFRTEALRDVGLFCEDFLYGYEELHLAWRMIDRGWVVRYAPTIEVFHHHSSAWRLSDETRATSELSNKWHIAAELLPLRGVPRSIAPYTLKSLWRMRRNGIPPGPALRAAAAAFRRGWRSRRPLSNDTLTKILSIRGRL